MHGALPTIDPELGIPSSMDSTLLAVYLSVPARSSVAELKKESAHTEE
jgi:hypothetical protein